MLTINSNVKGVLEYFQRNEDLTFKIKLLGEDGKFHIYDSLVRANATELFEVGDFIGEAEVLNYRVENGMLG